jgi:hypothetical protein
MPRGARMVHAQMRMARSFRVAVACPGCRGRSPPCLREGGHSRGRARFGARPWRGHVEGVRSCCRPPMPVFGGGRSRAMAGARTVLNAARRSYRTGDVTPHPPSLAPRRVIAGRIVGKIEAR